MQAGIKACSFSANIAIGCTVVISTIRTFRTKQMSKKSYKTPPMYYVLGKHILCGTYISDDILHEAHDKILRGVKMKGYNETHSRLILEYIRRVHLFLTYKLKD